MSTVFFLNFVSSNLTGHSFCRKCLRGALAYSSRCPKCRETLVPGFTLNVNTVLWNTVQMLFPHTAEAPASPTPPTTMRRAAECERRERLRDVRTAANFEAGRRSAMDNYQRGYEQPGDMQRSSSYTRNTQSTSRSDLRRLRLNLTTRTMSSSPTGVSLRGRPIIQHSLGRNHVSNMSSRSISQVSANQQSRLRVHILGAFRGRDSS